MSTPESIAEAFGRGLMQGMIAQNGKPEKPEKVKPAVIKTDDVRAAVAEFLGPLINEQPQQQDLFPPPYDLGEDVLERINADRMAAAEARADARDRGAPEPGTFNPDFPNGTPPWTSPIQS